MRRLGRANSKTPLLGHSCEKGTIKHSFPMKYVLKPWKLGRWFYQVVKFGIVQYVTVETIFSSTDTVCTLQVGGEERTIAFMRRLGRANSKTPLLGYSCEKGTIKHSFPMKYVLKPWKLGRWFYQVVKFCIVQYMIIKILTALLAVILEAFGMYCEGEFNWECG
ncbi:hypothetical protein Gotur_000500 [Gossypium turneri]